MSFDYEVDPVGLAAFVSRARQFADDLGAASPSGDGSLSTLTEEAGALSDPDISGLLSGIFSDRQSDLTNAVTAVTGAIASVEQAGSTVCEADGTSHGTFSTLSTGAFDPSRFSAN